jgi:hypothetical protein
VELFLETDAQRLEFVARQRARGRHRALRRRLVGCAGGASIALGAPCGRVSYNFGFVVIGHGCHSLGDELREHALSGE